MMIMEKVFKFLGLYLQVLIIKEQITLLGEHIPTLDGQLVTL